MTPEQRERLRTLAEVMAGMARSGSVYELTLLPGMLEKAFHNTVDLVINGLLVILVCTFYPVAFFFMLGCKR